jgi:hypothetical protein
LLPAAVAAGQVVQTTTNAQGAPGPDAPASGTDLIGATNKVAERLAMAGWSPDAMLSNLSLRYRAANIRDQHGRPVFTENSFNGFTSHFNQNGAWPGSAGQPDALIVDSSRVKIGVRQDIQVKFLDQATLGTGANQLNLAERDMVALRLKARYAYVLGISATPYGSNKTPVGAVIPTPPA